MADKLFLEVVSPECRLISMEVDEVVASGVEGEFGVLAGHAPYLTCLKAGELSIKVGKRVEHIAVDGGFFEISNDKVVVLADGAIHAEKIDVEITNELLAKASKIMEDNKGLDNDDYRLAEIEFVKQTVRLEVAGKFKKHQH